MPDFVPMKYDPSRKRISVQFSGSIFYHLAWAYAAVKLNQISTICNTGIQNRMISRIKGVVGWCEGAG